MPLERLFKDVSPREFVEKYLHRIPLPQPGGAADFASLGSWETIGRVLASGGSPDVVVVKDNRRIEETSPLTIERARQRNAEGCTVSIRHVERHDERVAALAADFERELGGAVNVHLYCTPPGEHGFGWHYDAEDVFILQAKGAKDYSLRKNTIHPWPTVESMPGDLHFERERSPRMDCRLAAGDCLYLPAGYWHRAQGSGTEDSISLAVGVLFRTGVDAFDALRQWVVASLVWRQRLPILGEASGLSEDELFARYSELLRDLGKDAADTLRNPEFVRDFIAALRREPAPAV